MNLKIKQTNQFKKSIKKLSKQSKSMLDKQVRNIAENPLLGVLKKGDLDFLRVHKFKIANQQYLLGYTFQEDIMTLTLLRLGSHENFYRDLKR